MKIAKMNRDFGNVGGLTLKGIDLGAGIDTGDATAVAGDIVEPKTAYGPDGKIIGAMPDRGAVDQTITTQSGQYIVPEGYHNGTGSVKAEFNNLLPENVLDSVDIGGVVGTAYPITIGNFTIYENNAVKGHTWPGTSIAYEVEVMQKGRYSLSYQFRRSSGSTYGAYAGILVNGVEVREDRSETSSWATYTYNTPLIEKGSTIAILLKPTYENFRCEARSFRISIENPLTSLINPIIE